jgi:TonB family protein
MPLTRTRIAFALACSLAIHAGLLAPWAAITPPPPPPPLEVRIMEVPVPVPEQRDLPQTRQEKKRQVAAVTPQAPGPVREPASLAAPSPPSAEEWKLASTYAPRNGKRYRHAWGRQVRSMMGTAVEGPDQGMVRFRIEIAPDGKVAKVEELWSTSEKASKLALQAIRNLPPLPPTPTGKPLVFEQTISFLPYETGWPPNYKLDCLPEPEPFKNPFAWDGASPQQVVERAHRPPPPEECPPDSTAETIEEEEQSFKRQMDQWRWAR